MGDLGVRLANVTVAVILLALPVSSRAHHGDDGGHYDYPLAAGDVTVQLNHLSVVYEPEGWQRITVRQRVQVATAVGADTYQAPAITWQADRASAHLLAAQVTRAGQTVFRLGPQRNEPKLPLRPSRPSVGPTQQARIPLPELRPGDVVEWAVELREVPLIDGHLFAHMNWQVQYPVEEALFRVQAPADLGERIAYRSFGEVPDPTVTETADTVTWEWRISERVEPCVGSGSPVPRQTIVSSATSWDVIGAWYREKLSAAGDDLEALGPDREQRLTPADDYAERLDHVLEFVGANVEPTRWLVGADPFTPQAPAAVLRGGVGDCKDIAWLMYRLCAEAGLAPHLGVTCLARTLPSLGEQPPTPLFLDHVVVGISGPGRTLWLDPTGAARREVDSGRPLHVLVVDRTPPVVTTVDRFYMPPSSH